VRFGLLPAEARGLHLAAVVRAEVPADAVVVQNLLDGAVLVRGDDAAGHVQPADRLVVLVEGLPAGLHVRDLLAGEREVALVPEPLGVDAVRAAGGPQVLGGHVHGHPLDVLRVGVVDAHRGEPLAGRFLQDIERCRVREHAVVVEDDCVVGHTRPLREHHQIRFAGGAPNDLSGRGAHHRVWNHAR